MLFVWQLKKHALLFNQHCRYFSKPNATNVVDIKPRKVDAPPVPAGDEISVVAPPAKGSAWNSAGTFEERSFGPWLRGRIKDLLLEARRAGLLMIELKPGQWLCARGISGWGSSSADILIARGKARYVYDLHFSVVFEVLSEEKARVLADSPASLADEEAGSAASVDEPKEEEKEAPAPVAPAEGGSAATADGGAAVAAVSTPAAAPEKEKPPARILLSVEAGEENEKARDLAVVGGKPKPSEGTLARAREQLDVKARSVKGVVSAVCEALETAIAEYRAK